ncbi:MAG: glycosyltransferase family 39 protein [Ruminococcus sp.]|nr:glycosyltransferase family 39 protein [Ruminococcus sp.]
MKKISITVLINLLFIFLSGAILLVETKYFLSFLTSNPILSLAVCMIVGIIVSVCFVLHKRKRFELINNVIDKASIFKLSLIVFIISLLSKLVITFILNFNCLDNSIDMDWYVNWSCEVAQNGHTISPSEVLLEFPHVFWYAVFLLPITIFFGHSHIVISVYLAVIISISIALLYNTVAHIFNKNIIFVVAVLILLNPSQLLLNQVITHEIAFLFFMSLSIWLYFRILPKCDSTLKKSLVFLIFSIFVFFSLKVNSTGYVLYIAYIICFILQKDKYSVIKNVALKGSRIVCLILVLIIGTSIFNVVLDNLTECKNKNVGNAVFWTLYVGSNADTVAGWSLEDAHTLNAYPDDFTQQQINDYQKNLVKDRYSDLIKNKHKLFKLILGKFFNMWRSFDYPILMCRDDYAKKSDSYIDLFFILALFQSLIYLLTTIFFLFTNFKNRFKMLNLNPKNNLTFTFMQLVVIGFTMLLMFTEIINKYVIAIQPLFFIICICYCLYYFTNKVDSKKTN